MLKLSNSSNIPKKPLSQYFVYFLFLCQGIGLLMPWNTLLVSATYYEESRLSGLAAAKSIWPYFAIIFMTVKFLFLMFSSFVFHLISLERQIVVFGTGNAVIFLCLTLLALDPQGGTISDSTYFGLILTFGFLTSICCGFLNNALYTLLGKYDPKHIQALSNGQGIAGVLPAVVRIAVSYAVEDTSISSLETCLTFAFSTLVMIICVLLFIGYHDRDHSIDDTESFDNEKNQNNINPEIQDNSFSNTLSSHLKVIRHVLWYAMSVMLVFFVTLSLFPIFYFKTESIYLAGATGKQQFYYSKIFPLVNILLFNMGDWFGKLIPMVESLIIKNKFIIFAASVSRFVYFPLFFLGNVTGFGNNYPMSHAFASDAVFYIVSYTFGMTNGYLSTISMMKGPSSVPISSQRTKGATVMVFFLTTGLTLGAYMALILNEVLTASSK